MAIPCGTTACYPYHDMRHAPKSNPHRASHIQFIPNASEMTTPLEASVCRTPLFPPEKQTEHVIMLFAGPPGRRQHAEGACAPHARHRPVAVHAVPLPAVRYTYNYVCLVSYLYYTYNHTYTCECKHNYTCKYQPVAVHTVPRPRFVARAQTMMNSEVRDSS